MLGTSPVRSGPGVELERPNISVRNAPIWKRVSDQPAVKSNAAIGENSVRAGQTKNSGDVVKGASETRTLNPVAPSVSILNLPAELVAVPQAAGLRSEISPLSGPQTPAVIEPARPLLNPTKGTSTASSVAVPTVAVPVEIPVAVQPPSIQPAATVPMPNLAETGTIAESQPVAVQVPMQPVLEVRLREKQAKGQDPIATPTVPLKVNAAVTVPVAAAAHAGEHDREPMEELPALAAEPTVPVKSILSEPVAAHVSAPSQTAEQSSGPALAHAVTPLPEKPENLQQMRTFSLEFSPEGAAGDPSRDVRLHVTQRSGDVHISVDSNDALLSNKLRDGVEDLVGHMTQAGYEADAWSQGGGERRRAPEPEPETKPVIKDATDGIAFEQIFQSKEIL